MQIDPVAFRIFGISVYWYGIMISLGMLAGICGFKADATLQYQ